MRVVTRCGRDEQGATAVVVALVLFVLVGMLALSVDGGLLLSKYRQVRRASDAAALAAAISCQMGQPADAATKADEYARTNIVDSAEPPATRVFVRFQDLHGNVVTQCGKSGKVTVRYTARQSLMFGPAVGVSSPKWVEATATAAWGAAGGSNQVAPLMLSLDRMHSPDCNMDPPTGLVVGQSKCVFYFNNSKTYIGNAGWGTMDLDPDNDLSTPWYKYPQSCNSAPPPQYSDWMANGFPGTLELNPNGPTYVCAGQGMSRGPLMNAINGAIATGDTYAFPVNNPQDTSRGPIQIDKQGVPCPSPCSPDKYSIIGFAWLKPTLVLDGNGNNPDDVAAWNANCNYPGMVRESTAFCLVTTWEGYSTDGTAPRDGGNFGLLVVGLSE